ncbi:IS66 family transposase [Puteibacter caeruleilacunae]|nr:IS66 family transposase [Puteibacter caeruleilacunae]
MKKSTKNKEQDVVSTEQFKKLQQENDYLRGQLLEMQRLIFGGGKQEPFIATSDATQLSILDQEKQETEEQQTEDISYTRKKKSKEKKKPVRAKLPAHLPRVEEVIEPDEKPEGAKRIGEEITEILEFTPAQIYVRKIIRPKYARPDGNGIDIANMPSLPIPRGNAGPSMLAQIMVAKFVDHLPYYRQINMYKRSGIVLSDSTLNDWFNATSELIKPLYGELKEQVLKSDYLQADESPIKVQDSHKKGTLHKGYQWLYRAPVEGLVFFQYNPSRAKKVVEETLMDFSGTLQTDGYKAYNNLKTKGDIHL